MAAEHPRVVKRQNQRDLLAQPGKGPQIKVAPVQVVAVDDVWPLWWNLKDPPRLWKVEILRTLPPIEETPRATEEMKLVSQPPGTPNLPNQWRNSLSEAKPESGPVTIDSVIPKLKHVRAGTTFKAHRQP
jgi:hypothetical protein